MTAPQAQHPSPEDLAAFAVGKLSDADAATVASHLESCAECRRAAESAPDDSFLSRVKGARPVEPPGGGTPLPAGLVPGLPPELAGHPRYRILRELGRGGMGVVYQARHALMNRQVVVKVIGHALLDHPAALERFRREARMAARLSHPNIVTAYDIERAGDLHMLVLEFVPGQNLAEVLHRHGPLPVARACHYARQTALGLQHAFDQGMVHRDIKPHNLMLTPEGQVKILDFGLAKLVSERGRGQSLTGSNAYMGTPEYCAPEQATDARTADIRADVYSLGCTLYCLLAGRPPFRETSPMQTILAHLKQQPVPLPDLRPDLPARLWAVVAKMLAKDPAERHQTPAEAARALLPFCKPEPKAAPARKPAAREPTVPPLARPAEAAPRPRTGVRPPPAWYRRWRVLAGAAAALVVLALGTWLLIAFLAQVREQTAAAFALLDTAHGRTTAPARGGSKREVAPAIPPSAKEKAPPPAVDPRLRRAYRNGNGSWRIEGGELLQEVPGGGDCSLAFGDLTWKDYDFACEAQKIGGRGELGPLYRVNAGGRGEFILGRWDGTWESAASMDLSRYDRMRHRRTSAVQDGRWYGLRVRVRGAHYQCFIDDQLVFDFDDPKNPQGGVGLRTWSTSARFRNLRVTDPAGKLLFEGLPALPAEVVPWIRES